MEKTNEFLIPIGGLSIGKHNYHYSINDDFFADMEYSEIKQGNLDFDMEVDREESMVTFTFDFQGKVRVACDRCAEDFDLPVEGNEVFYLKLGADYHEESDDVVVIPATQQEFDVRSLIYEYIILSLPIHRTHEEGACNPEVLKLLNQTPAAEEKNDDEIDPRWGALKDLKID